MANSVQPNPFPSSPVHYSPVQVPGCFFSTVPLRHTGARREWHWCDSLAAPRESGPWSYSSLYLHGRDPASTQHSIDGRRVLCCAGSALSRLSLLAVDECPWWLCYWLFMFRVSQHHYSSMHTLKATWLYLLLLQSPTDC